MRNIRELLKYTFDSSTMQGLGALPLHAVENPWITLDSPKTLLQLSQQNLSEIGCRTLSPIDAKSINAHVPFIKECRSMYTVGPLHP